MGYVFDTATSILISLSLMLIAGFLVTRLTKRLGLPNVTGYIIAGILMGPYVLDIIPGYIAQNMSFVGDIALAFIAFDVGKFLEREVLAQTGKQVILITLFESLITGIVVTLTMHYLLAVSWRMALLLGAIATATAPASTMMTINQYQATGDFVNILLQVVALDDVVCLIAFSLVIAFVDAAETGIITYSTAVLPVVYNILALALGFLSGVLLSRILTPDRSDDNRLILTIALLLGLSGLCSIFDISPLMACMVLGATYINIAHDRKLYRQINNFTPPILSLFFILSGIKLNIASLSTLGLLGVAYFLTRIIGKYLGAYLGCYFMDTQAVIRNYLGLALVPQAGVAIGLAFLGERLLPVSLGNRLLTIILASSVLYELIGPACAKLALVYSGTIEAGR
ncbi:MAG: cation:proton antiporter [Firmicutes bacterium]|nr:cation:proton antiporter [Bacillota bacterium]